MLLLQMQFNNFHFKVFFRAGVVAHVEDLRDARLSQLITGFQAQCRWHVGLVSAICEAFCIALIQIEFSANWHVVGSRLWPIAPFSTTFVPGCNCVPGHGSDFTGTRNESIVKDGIITFQQGPALVCQGKSSAGHGESGGAVEHSQGDAPKGTRIDGQVGEGGQANGNRAGGNGQGV